MIYRNGTYIAFDENREKNQSKSDLKYYNLLRVWNKN